MAIAYQHSGAGQTTSGTSHSIALPGGDTSGEVVIFLLQYSVDPGARSGTDYGDPVKRLPGLSTNPTLPAGWANQHSQELLVYVCDGTTVGANFSITTTNTCIIDYLTLQVSGGDWGDWPIRGVNCFAYDNTIQRNRPPKIFNDQHTGMTACLAMGEADSANVTPEYLNNMPSWTMHLETVTDGTNTDSCRVAVLTEDDTASNGGPDSGAISAYDPATFDGTGGHVISQQSFATGISFWTILIREKWNAGGTAILRPAFMDYLAPSVEFGTDFRKAWYTSGVGVPTEQSYWYAACFMEGITNALDGSTTKPAFFGGTDGPNNHPAINNSSPDVFMDPLPDDYDGLTNVSTGFIERWASTDYGPVVDDTIVSTATYYAGSGNAVNSYTAGSHTPGKMDIYNGTDWTDTSAVGYTGPGGGGSGTAPADNKSMARFAGETGGYTPAEMTTSRLGDASQVNGLRIPSIGWGHNVSMANDQCMILVEAMGFEVAYATAAGGSLPPRQPNARYRHLLVR